MTRNRALYGTLLLAALIFYIFTNSYYALLALLLCVLLPLLALGLLLLGRKGLTLSLELPSLLQKPQPVPVVYALQGARKVVFLRAGWTVQVVNQLTGTRACNRIQCAVAGKDAAHGVRLELAKAAAGELCVSTRRFKVYDCLGLFCFSGRAPEDQTCLLLPDASPAAVQMKEAAQTLVYDGDRYSNERPGQDVTEIFSLRDYLPGDALRSIHWKLSAKRERTIVREFGLLQSYPVLLLVDLVNTGSEVVLDTCLQAAMSLSAGLLAGGCPHNLAWYDGQRFCVREVGDFAALDVAMAGLLRGGCCQDAPLALACYAASEYLRRAMSLLYVTSALDADAVARVATMQAMKTLYVLPQEQREAQLTDADAPWEDMDVYPVSAPCAVEALPAISL